MAVEISRELITSRLGGVTYDRFLFYLMGPYKSFNLRYVLSEAERDEIEIEDLPGPLRGLFRNEEAIPSARETLRQKSLDRLSDHQLALYQVLRDGEELMPKEIRTRYAGRVDDPRSERTVRKYLRKLEQYNLIASDGRGPSRVYRTVDS
jgi:hypothetical protein